MKEKLLASVIMVVFVAACVGQSNPYQAKIGNSDVTFRANLDKAKDVALTPDKVALKTLLLDPYVNKIYVAYVPEDDYNGFYLVTAYEITYKMTLIQLDYYGDMPKMEALELNSSEEAYALAGKWLGDKRRTYIMPTAYTTFPVMT